MTGISVRGFRAALAVFLLLAMGACLPGADKSGAAKPGATNVISGDAIEATPLDPPSPAAKPAAADPIQPGQAGAPRAAETQPPAKPGVEGASGATPADAPETPTPVAEEVVKSEARLACEKAKGIWSNTGGGITSCVWNTKDSGKRCTSATQCEGDCLARSGTCSPFRPLFGCNEILDDSGRRMTECLQ